MSERGLIAAIYGMNNIGKTSVLRGVLECLGTRAFSIKYPIYDSPTGRRINAYLREGNPEGMSPLDAQKVFAQDRIAFEPELIRRSQGQVAVLEDYNGTGKAWGMVTAGATIEEMEEINRGQLEPDLNILLDGERFRSNIEQNHKHESGGDELWIQVRNAHLLLAKRYQWEVVKVSHGELEREVKEVTELIMRLQRE